MELPFGSAATSRSASDTGSLTTASSLADGESGSARSWLDGVSQETGGAAREPGASRDSPVDATSAIPRSRRTVLQASYWRYLQHVTSSDADLLTAAEVLELLLHFGGSAENAGVCAAQLLDRFGSLGAAVCADPMKLKDALRDDELSVMLLKAVLAAVKAIVREPLEDRPVICSASALMDYLSLTMRHEPREALRILFLDRKNGLIKDEIHHRGTVDQTALYTREVVRRVIELGASAIILVHNHPSGDPTPSKHDINVTQQLVAALKTINVALHDHVIVGRNKQISLRKECLI